MLGENYDARLEVKGWNEPGIDDSAWTKATVREEAPRPLESQVTEPVRKICEIQAKTITEPKPGCWTFDLGQNMVGYVRLKVAAPAGTKLTLRHAEMLNPDGTLYTTNLRSAASIDTYICKGGGVEIYQPHFTFHGFRYVELTGLAAKPALDAVTGIVIASDTPRAGEFACSDPRINQLYSNICWGQRGNYLSIPTDCPQRDERLGWMGDAQVFVRTATYNADVAAFFTKWLVDVDDAQRDGAFTDVSPGTGCGEGTPAWADAGVICPWTIYQVYGDTRLLEPALSGDGALDRMVPRPQHRPDPRQGPRRRLRRLAVHRRRHAQGPDRHRLLRLFHTAWSRRRPRRWARPTTRRNTSSSSRTSRRRSTRSTSPPTGGSRATPSAVT